MMFQPSNRIKEFFEVNFEFDPKRIYLSTMPLHEKLSLYSCLNKTDLRATDIISAFEACQKEICSTSPEEKLAIFVSLINELFEKSSELNGVKGIYFDQCLKAFSFHGPVPDRLIFTAEQTATNSKYDADWHTSQMQTFLSREFVNSQSWCEKRLDYVHNLLMNEANDIDLLKLFNSSGFEGMREYCDENTGAYDDMIFEYRHHLITRISDDILPIDAVAIYDSLKFLDDLEFVQTLEFKEARNSSLLQKLRGDRLEDVASLIALYERQPDDPNLFLETDVNFFKEHIKIAARAALRCIKDGRVDQKETLHLIFETFSLHAHYEERFQKALLSAVKKGTQQFLKISESDPFFDLDFYAELLPCSLTFRVPWGRYVREEVNKRIEEVFASFKKQITILSNKDLPESDKKREYAKLLKCLRFGERLPYYKELFNLKTAPIIACPKPFLAPLRLMHQYTPGDYETANQVSCAEATSPFYIHQIFLDTMEALTNPDKKSSEDINLIDGNLRKLMILSLKGVMTSQINDWLSQPIVRERMGLYQEDFLSRFRSSKMT